MVFLPNLGVNRRSRLCDVASYVSAQELDFLDLEQKSSSVNWKHQKVPMPNLPIYGWALFNKRIQKNSLNRPLRSRRQER
jgi:hypothetical protein